MNEDGSTKDDVKVPEGETGDKITKLQEDGKDTSMLRTFLLKLDHAYPLISCYYSYCHG